jgi:hypothetical protein
MPNNTNNPQDIKSCYTQEDIDSLISEKAFDKLIKISPYLTIKSIKDGKIDPNILTYDHYIKLATSSEDHITFRDIENIMNNMGSLSDDQQKVIKEKLKETKEALEKGNRDKFFDVLTNSMKLSTQVEGEETQVEGREMQVEGEEVDGGKTKKEPDSLLQVLHEFYLTPLSWTHIAFLSNDAEEYLKKDFRDNARKFIDEIASGVESGNITPETNPGLILLQQAFSLSNEEKSQEKAIRDITKRGRILGLKHALPILGEELWENKTMLKAIIDGENEASNEDVENYFNSNSAYFRDYASRKVTEMLAESGKRKITVPNAPSRNVAPRVTQPTHGHGGHGFGGHGFGGHGLGGHGL